MKNVEKNIYQDAHRIFEVRKQSDLFVAPLVLARVKKELVAKP
ncbi:MAG: hypothetical protein WC460_03105 [Patescibacteria group bacterium]